MEHLGTYCDWEDSTIKGIYRGSRGAIEVSLLKNKWGRGYDVLCLPTHHYCNLGCRICFLTQEGFSAPMYPVDEDELLEATASTLGSGEARLSSQRRVLLSFMGVGEPLLNLDLIRGMARSERWRDLGYSDACFGLATMMPTRALEGLAAQVSEDKIPLKVHFSLHTPFSGDRRALLPKARVDVEEAFGLLWQYRERARGQIGGKLLEYHSTDDPAEIHYTLIEGVNDSDRHLEGLLGLLDRHPIQLKFLRFSETGDMRASRRLDEWIGEIRRSIPDLRVRAYAPPGSTIGSSCGQFTKRHYLPQTPEELAEFEAWAKEHAYPR